MPSTFLKLKHPKLSNFANSAHKSRTCFCTSTWPKLSSQGLISIVDNLHWENKTKAPWQEIIHQKQGSKIKREQLSTLIFYTHHDQKSALAEELVFGSMYRNAYCLSVLSVICFLWYNQQYRESMINTVPPQTSMPLCIQWSTHHAYINTQIHRAYFRA